MRKLKLESLQVESFATSVVSRERGTVDAHGDPQPTPPTVIVLETYDVEACGHTGYFDCSLGCSYFTGCDGPCGETEYDCIVPPA